MLGPIRINGILQAHILFTHAWSNWNQWSPGCSNFVHPCLVQSESMGPGRSHFVYTGVLQFALRNSTNLECCIKTSSNSMICASSGEMSCEGRYEKSASANGRMQAAVSAAEPLHPFCYRVTSCPPTLIIRPRLEPALRRMHSI